MKARFFFTAILIATCFTGCDRKRGSAETSPPAAQPDSKMEKVEFVPDYDPFVKTRKRTRHFLTIEEFDAPPGYADEKYVPGKYVVKGTYNLQRTNIHGATIRFGFMGSWSGVAEYTQDKLQIPAGQATGTFELSQGIREWRSSRQGTNQFPVVELEITPLEAEKIFLHTKANSPR